MTNTVIKAKIYEAQGLKEDALEVYKNVLKTDPTNKDALTGVLRLSENLRPKNSINTRMKELFLTMSTPDEVLKFKRWLVEL